MVHIYHTFIIDPKLQYGLYIDLSIEEPLRGASPDERAKKETGE